MRRSEILALYDRELRAEAPPLGVGHRREREGTVVRSIGPSPAAHDNCILFSRLDDRTVDAAIQNETARFASFGHAFEWKVHGHDGPADLGQRLRHRGFAAETPETVMVRDLVDDPPRPPAATSVDIRRIDQAARMPDLIAVQNQVWNDDCAWYGDALAGELAADATQIEILVAYAQGRPVATSLLRLHRGTSFASIWGAAVLAAFRRRRIYGTLVERHASTARGAGARLVAADANADSRPVLERIGFQPLIGVRGFVSRPGG